MALRFLGIVESWHPRVRWQQVVEEPKDWQENI